MGKRKKIPATLAEEYERALGERERLQALLDGLEQEERQTSGALEEDLAITERMQALKVGIEKFLSNFRFGQIYDYRSALAQLKDNIRLYAEKLAFVQEKQNKLREMGDGQPPINAEDATALRLQSAGLQSEKTTLTEERARLISAMETEDGQALKGRAYSAEAESLHAEKERLERRLVAVRSAKELLTRARENMATRYLQPVEEGCKRYLAQAGFSAGADGLKFSGADRLTVTENGATHSIEYYSDGLKELVGFCTRLALIDALFTGVRPVVVLDDPFVNLDDSKTEIAKRLVRALSERTQVVYFTCKSERAL